MAASKVFPASGVALRIRAAVRDISGKLITGGLGTLSATISKDDGTAASTSNTPVEIATNTSVCYLDLTAAECTASAIVVTIASTATDAVKSVVEVRFDGLAEIWSYATGISDLDDDAVLEVIKLIFKAFFNAILIDRESGQHTVYDDGATYDPDTEEVTGTVLMQTNGVSGHDDLAADVAFLGEKRPA